MSTDTVSVPSVSVSELSVITASKQQYQQSNNNRLAGLEIDADKI